MVLLYKRVLQAWSYLELELCCGVAAQVTAPQLASSYALTWRPACLWTEAWHGVADLAELPSCYSLPAATHGIFSKFKPDIVGISEYAVSYVAHVAHWRTSLDL